MGEKKLVQETLDKAIMSMERDHFPTTTYLLERCKFLSKNFTTPDGQIETNRLELSIISIIGDLERRIKSLEDRLNEN